VNINDITFEQFQEKYEKGDKPVIITGASKGWKAKKQWSFKNLLKRFAKSRFKVAEDDDGTKLKVNLAEYIEYVFYNRDDSPLYLFESCLEEHPEAKIMMDDYKPAECFGTDLFTELFGEAQAPPHRWFLIGPKRSGSEVHQDPLGTSAWNCSTSGRKRWVMIPPTPGLDKKTVRGRKYTEDHEDDEAIHYFDFILPRLKEAEGPAGTNQI